MCRAEQVLDSLADPISTVLKKKTKENASPQDIERHNELQRSAMVTVRRVTRLAPMPPACQSCPWWCTGPLCRRHLCLFWCGGSLTVRHKLSLSLSLSLTHTR